MLITPQVLLNVSTAAIHDFKLAPIPNDSLVKGSQTLMVQLIADEVDPNELQVVSFHPGTIFSETAEKAGLSRDSFPWDNGKQTPIVSPTSLRGRVKRHRKS